MRLRSNWQNGLAALAFAATAGCATTSEYARFAQAGSAYATAMDHVLIAAGTTSVDATSERLLQDDAIANQDVQSYRRLSDIDVERLATIARLRSHTQLLAVYFQQLEALARPEASARAAAEVGAVVDSLSSLGLKLRARPDVRRDEALHGLTPLVIGAHTNAALRHELVLRQEIIRRELVTQETLLNQLASEIAHDVELTREAQETRLVIRPLAETTPVSNTRAWTENRRAILLSGASLEELARGRQAGTALRVTFEDLVAGKATPGRIEALLASIDGLLSVAATLSR